MQHGKHPAFLLAFACRGRHVPAGLWADLSKLVQLALGVVRRGTGRSYRAVHPQPVRTPVTRQSRGMMEAQQRCLTAPATPGSPLQPLHGFLHICSGLCPCPPLLRCRVLHRRPVR